MSAALTRHEFALISSRQTLSLYLRDLEDHLLHIMDTVNTAREALNSTVELYLTATSNRLNRVVNRLTIITIVIGIFTVISGFYGMNFLQTWPPFTAEWGVPFVLALMVLVAGTALALLRRFRLF
jgi:magnesium transporter